MRRKCWLGKMNPSSSPSMSVHTSSCPADPSPLFQLVPCWKHGAPFHSVFMLLGNFSKKCTLQSYNNNNYSKNPADHTYPIKTELLLYPWSTRSSIRSTHCPSCPSTWLEGCLFRCKCCQWCEKCHFGDITRPACHPPGVWIHACTPGIGLSFTLLWR